MGTFVNDFVHGLKASSSGTLLPIQAVGLNYLKCTTAAGTAEKAVSALTGFKLLEGASVIVSFVNTNTAANPTLKVGTTAAKPIYYRGSAISAGYLAAGRVYQFTYDGNYWQLIGDLNTDSSAYQNAVTTANTNFPIILGYDGRTTAVNGAVNKSSTLLFNPSTNLLSTPKISVSTMATFNGSTAIDNATIGDLIVNGGTSFLNIPTAPTAADGTNNSQLATTEFVYNAFRVNDAMVFKGVVNSNSELPATHYQGWTYKIGSAGTFAGLTCEVGDTIYCVTDGTSANNAHWVVVLNNIDTFPWSRISGKPSRFATNYVDLYEARSATTTLNKTANYVAAGAMFHLCASSSTSSADNGKTPMGDANILQMNWDNADGYDSQLGIHTADNRMEFRSRASLQTAWREVVTATPNTAAGSSTVPVYITSSGVATACSYSLSKSVPSDAIFTDQYVSQTETTTSDWRKILVGYLNNSSPTTNVSNYTNVAYVSKYLEYLPSTGTLLALAFKVTANATITYNTSNGCLEITV